jgi:hypothetical protein
MRLLRETKEEMYEMELKVLDVNDHWVIIEKPKEVYVCHSLLPTTTCPNIPGWNAQK